SVPFAAGSLGSQQRHDEDSAEDRMVVALRDRAASDSHTGLPVQRTVQALQEYLMVLAPQRLPYEIQMASGWDTGFPPEELVGLMQTAAGKGWHTPRFCSYPQDLVLRFSCGHSRIRKIQLLSHQYKIASRLDFWMGSRKGVQAVRTDPMGIGNTPNNDSRHHSSPYGGDDDYDDNSFRAQDAQNRSLPVLQFQKLGSISFDSNANSKYSGRELRSINVDVEGEYLRVVIRQCHANPMNIYHQVAILALNVLGEPLEGEMFSESEKLDFNEFEVVNGPGQGLSDQSLAKSVPPISETTEEVPNIVEAVRSLSIAEVKELPSKYMDHEILRLITGFTKAKQDAAKEEDFQAAKSFKTGCEDLTKFADQIQDIDIKKQQAVNNDEFDTAQDLKIKVSEIKARMYEYFSQGGFFFTDVKDTIIVSLEALEAPEVSSQLGSFSPGNSLHAADRSTTHSNNQSFSGLRNPSSRRSAPPSVINQSIISSTASDNSSDPERLKSERHNGKSTTVPGRPQSMGLVRQKSSWQTRHSTTPNQPTILGTVGEGPFSTLDDTLDLSDDLTEQERKDFAGLLDVFPGGIVSCLISRDINLRQRAIEYIKEHLENESYADDNEDRNDPSEIPNESTYPSLEPLVPLLLVKAGDLNARVTQATINKIVVLCNCFRTYPCSILPLVFKPARGTVLYRQAQARVEVVARLVDEFGVYDRAAGKGTPGGLEFQDITEFTTPYLSHTNSEVRVAARKLITDICKFLNKTRVEQFLPGVKTLIVESIQKELEGKRPDRSASVPLPTSTRASSNSSSTRYPSNSLSTRTPPNSSSVSDMTSRATTLSSTKRRQVPASLGVNLHVDSLKSLLNESDLPASPGLSKANRQSSRQRSDAAIAHQARLRMPLKSSIRAAQDVYSGIPKSMVKRQATLSPDDENDSTASEETRMPSSQAPSQVASKPAVRPSQLRSRTSSSVSGRASGPKQAISTVSSSSRDHRSGSDVQSTTGETKKDRFCVFCDEQNNGFTDEALVTHYWNDCAMLANCPHCKIIIEVPTLSDHMLNDCPKKKFVKQCEQCQEVMEADAFLAHVAAGCIGKKPDYQQLVFPTSSHVWTSFNIIPALLTNYNMRRIELAHGADTARCPLCLLILPNNEEATWKRHLTQGAGCPKSKKSLARIQKQRPTPVSRYSSSSLQMRQKSPHRQHTPKIDTSNATTSSVARGYALDLKQQQASLSPTSPLSSSSSSSTRLDRNARYRGSSGTHVSTTVSPASSTNSSAMIEKSSIPSGRSAPTSASHSTATIAAIASTYSMTSLSTSNNSYGLSNSSSLLSPLASTPIPSSSTRRNVSSHGSNDHLQHNTSTSSYHELPTQIYAPRAKSASSSSLLARPQYLLQQQQQQQQDSIHPLDPVPPAAVAASPQIGQSGVPSQAANGGISRIPKLVRRMLKMLVVAVTHWNSNFDMAARVLKAIEAIELACHG
ncbi:hypothetical protein BGW38_001474, partial [Lunasporangiospora selenospora]